MRHPHRRSLSICSSRQHFYSGSDNKQELLLAAAQNLGLLLRAKYGVGTPRRMADRARQAQQAATGLLGTLFVLLSTLWTKLSAPWLPPLQAQSACQLA